MRASPTPGVLTAGAQGHHSHSRAKGCPFLAEPSHFMVEGEQGRVFPARVCPTTLREPPPILAIKTYK